MRYSSPVIVFAAIVAAALGFQPETDPHRTADRAPASERKPKEAVPSSASRAPAATDAEIRGDSLWPSPGERWIYRFERKAAADFSGKSWLKLKIGGRAAVEPAGPRLYRISFSVDRLEMQGQTKNETRTFPGVRVEVDAEGKVRELRFATDREGATAVTEEEADLVRDLTAQWLFFENRSRLGAAEIEWSKAGSPGPVARMRTVTKRILRYPGRPEISKLDSVHEWATGGDEASGTKVERIEGTENFTVASANGDFVQSTSYRWLWTSTEKTPIRAEFAVGAPFTIEEATVARDSGTDRKVDPARIAREWTTLAGLSPHARLRLFRDAKRALDAGANELVSLIVKDLRGKASTSAEWRTGVGALASTTNPEAAAALLALYRENGRTADEKLSILSGVAAGEGPPAPAWKSTFEAALEAAPANPVSTAHPLDEKTVANFDPSRDFDPEAAVREASLYALGSSIRKETDAGRRAELEAVLWKEVKEATSEKAQAAVLEAIGNSGSGEYYAYIKESSGAGSPGVRAKAVAAVRFLASDLAKPIIDHAKGDPVPAVRKVAEWSAKFQAAAAPDPAE